MPDPSVIAIAFSLAGLALLLAVIFIDEMPARKPRRRVVGLTGYAQTGKDEAAQALVGVGYTRVAFADRVRDACYAFNPWVFDPYTTDWIKLQELVNVVGWDAAKTTVPCVRECLQRMGTEVGRELFGEDFWVEQAARLIDATGGPVVLSDVRFANEVELVRSRYGGEVFYCDRPGSKPTNGHVSDTGVDSLAFDGVLLNDGTIEAWRERVQQTVSGDN